MVPHYLLSGCQPTTTTVSKLLLSSTTDQPRRQASNLLIGSRTACIMWEVHIFNIAESARNWSFREFIWHPCRAQKMVGTHRWTVVVLARSSICAVQLVCILKDPLTYRVPQESPNPILRSFICIKYICKYFIVLFVFLPPVMVCEQIWTRHN